MISTTPAYSIDELLTLEAAEWAIATYASSLDALAADTATD